MSDQYYIVTGTGQAGPYDLVALIRKIRNGSLTATTLVQREGIPQSKPAQEWPALTEFFEAMKEEQAHQHTERGQFRVRTLGGTLTEGWQFLQRNQISAIFSGCIVLAIIMLLAASRTVLPEHLRTVGYMAAFVIGYFLVSLYMLIVLRIGRGQPVDFGYLVHKVLPLAKPLFISSLLICIPALIGLTLLLNGISITGEEASPVTLPRMGNVEVSISINPIILSVVGMIIFVVLGLYAFTLYVFTPLLILDQEITLSQAIEKSRAAVFKGGLENMGIIFALFVINFIAGLFAILPIALTLPLTVSPITDMYDEYFG